HPGDDERGDDGIRARPSNRRRAGPAPARPVERGRRGEVRTRRGSAGRGGAAFGRRLCPRPRGGGADEAGGAAARGSSGLMDLAGLRFQDPLWLCLSLLAPLTLVLALVRERAGRALVFPGLGRLHGGPRGWRVRVRHAPLALAALGLVAGSLALARPQ